MTEETKENIDIILGSTISIILTLGFIILGQKYGIIRQGESMTEGFQNTTQKIQEDVISLRIENEKLKKENAELKKELDSYKSLDSHYDEIEEDAKRIAEENEQLKAQLKEKWHDLRENPDDLPKEKTMYRVIYDNPMINQPAMWYLPSLKSWEHSGLPIIAWCELPKFEG